MTHWKRPWCWERWRAGAEGDNRGCGGWMASRTRRAWVWASSWSWWWTAWCAAGHGAAKSQTRLTELNSTERIFWGNGNLDKSLNYICHNSSSGAFHWKSVFPRKCKEQYWTLIDVKHSEVFEGVSNNNNLSFILNVSPKDSWANSGRQWRTGKPGAL